MYREGKINKQHQLKKPRILLLLLAVTGVIIVLVLVVKNMGAPAQGSISQAPASPVTQADPYAHPGIYKGKYVSFSYPAHYKKVPSSLTGGYVEIVDYVATDFSDKQINIGVAPGSIASDSGVAYRRQHKELYRENDSRLGVEFIKLDGTEDTFFIQRGSLLATVSATAPYGGMDGEALFVASSLKWI